MEALAQGAEHPFIIYTDHKSLEYLRTAKHLNPDKHAGPYFLPILASPCPTVQVLRTKKPMPYPVCMRQNNIQTVGNSSLPQLVS